MRVVNDRRRLPRVAWTGEVVVHGRGGEVRCRAVDIGAGGMSVLSSTSAKTRERIRLHTQLGNFPLLADAVIVRTSKTKEGYRWALRFDRIDDSTRANLEGFVRQQLANAARVRQAQLYAARMKSAPLPGAGPAAVWPTPVPTPVPTPAPISVPTPPPTSSEPALSGAAPPPGSVPLEIELPDASPSTPAIDRAARRAAPPAYKPYGEANGDDEDEPLAMLSDGPLTPAPSSPSSAAPNPSLVEPEPAEAPAPAFDPGVAAAEEAELLLGAPSDDAVVAPAAAAPPSPPAAPAPRAQPKAAPPPAPSSKPGETVWELDAGALDDEVSFAAVLAEADELAEQTPERRAAPRTGDTVMLPPEGTGPATPAPFSPATPLATPPSPSTVSPDVPAPRPVAAAPTFSDADEVFGGPIEDDETDSISLGDVEKSAAAAQNESAAPALVGAPFDLGGDADDDAVALSLQPDAPAAAAPRAPAMPATPAVAQTVPPRVPATGAPVEATPVASAVDTSEAQPFSLADPVSAAPFVAEPPVPTVPGEQALVRSSGADRSPPAKPAAPRQAAPPVASKPHEFGGLPFDAPPPVDAAPTESLGSEVEISDLDLDVAVAPAPATTAAPVAPPPAPKPASAAPQPPVPATRPEPQPAATPAYGDVAEPYDPYGPSPKPVSQALAKHPDVSSAPRTIGELPPAVEGLYTPASNPSLHDGGDSGVYQSASFQPFPSPTEEGLYGGESTLSFEDRRDDPRQRLAKLQVKVAPKPAPDDDSSMYLGDIEGATSGLTPTDTKMLRTDEDLRGSPFVDTPVPDSDMPTSVHSPQDGAGAPDSLLAAMPTGPVDVGVADYTPAPYDPNDSSVGAPFGIQGDHPPEALATAPGFAPVPDYEQPPEPSGESDDPLRRPAQSGHTIVASTELLGLDVPPVEPQRAWEPEPAPPASAPSDFQVLPAFSGKSDQPSNFTVVAGFEDMASSTMIATAAEVDAWRKAETAAPASGFDDEANTSYFTPAPGALAPILPPDVEALGGGDLETAVVGGSALTGGLDEAELTAMRVHPGGGSPAGAGFELNPRGVAQPMPVAPSSPPAAVPPAAAPPAAVPPAAAPPVGPGRSARRGTRLDQGGRPAPPPAPGQRPAPPQPPQGPGPAVLGSGRVGRAHTPLPSASEPVSEQAPTGPHGTVPVEPPKPAPSSRRSLVEDALQQLKRRTDEKRKDKKPEVAAEVPAKPKAPPPGKRRRRNLGKAEVSDPRIAELYHAALTDLSDKKVP